LAGVGVTVTGTGCSDGSDVIAGLRRAITLATETWLNDISMLVGTIVLLEDNRRMPKPDQPPEGFRVILIALLSLLWSLIGGLMALLAIVGLACAVLGALSLFVDFNGVLEMQLAGEPVRTSTQQVLFTGVGAVLTITGIVFWVLRQRGYVMGALLCYAAVLGLFLVIAWMSGRADVISIGSSRP
jgi:hypothetical protein